MHRYNICNRLITGELFYLSKHQQWVSDVTQAVTLNSRGTQTQRLDEGADAGDVLGVFMTAAPDERSNHDGVFCGAKTKPPTVWS